MGSVSADSSQSLSLFEYLLRENPVLDGARLHRGNNTKSVKLNYFMPETIQEWDDFRLDALNKYNGGTFRRLLNEKFHLHDYSGIPLYPFREIHDEDSLQCLLVKWNHSVVSEALEISQANLHNQISYNPPIYMVKGGQAECQPQIRPDWAGVCRSRISNAHKPGNILPGETKLSSKWKSNQIRLAV